ncbi:hypothetical protein DFQ26_002925 [Actinomortierella ambigua]|nr:hypothetical protein DFQ26_002925 [Actinomortierella ambigua]
MALLANAHLLAFLLAPSLENAELQSLAVTCKSMYEAFCPFLWEKVAFVAFSTATSSMRDYSDPDFAKTLIKHREHVREVCISTETNESSIQSEVYTNLSIFLDIVKKLCPNIIRLDAFYDSSRASPIADFMDTYRHNLLSVHLKLHDLSNGTWTKCLKALSGIDRLRKLKIDNLPMFIVFVLLQTLRTTSRGLKQIEFGICSKASEGLSTLVAKREECPLTDRDSRLAAFQAMVNKEYEGKGVVHVLDDCLQLFQDSLLPANTTTDAYFVPDALAVRFNLDVCPDTTKLVGNTLLLLSFMPENSLTRLELDNMCADDSVLSYIALAQRNLKSLRVAHLQTNIGTGSLQQLLVACRGLESIDLLSPHQISNVNGALKTQSTIVGTEPHIDASGLVSGERWGCTRLKHWNVHLSSICLLCQDSKHGSVDNNKPLFPSTEFWQQLGEMKHLRYLGFGHDLDHRSGSADNSRFHCFSLQDSNAHKDDHSQRLYEMCSDFNAAAVSHLVGLKNLEELFLCHEVMHQTTKECLQQWKAMWPKLRKVHGCGGYIEKTAIPEGKSQIGAFTAARQRNTDLIHSILTDSTEKLLQLDGSTEVEAARKNIEKMQSLFASCMNEDRLTQAGRQPLYDQVRRLLDIFPVQNSHLLPAFSSNTPEHETPQQKTKKRRKRGDVSSGAGSTDSDANNQTASMPPPPVAVASVIDQTTLAEVLAFLESINVDKFLQMSVGTDPIDPTINGMTIGESGLGLPSRQYYHDNATMDAYHSLIQTLFSTVLGPGPIDAATTDDASLKIDAVQIAQTVIDFEIRLAEIMTEPQDLRNAKLRNNPRTLDQLSALNPTVDWPGLLEQVVGSTLMNSKNVTVTSPTYQTKLAQLVGQTDMTTLQNYFAWKMIHEMTGYLSPALRKPLDEFDAMMKGVPVDKLPERWETCVDTVSGMLSGVVGHYYVMLGFSGSSKNQSDDIVTALRQQYVESMPKLDWLDPPTREQAVLKLNAMMQKVGYSTVSPNIASPQSLAEYYNGLEMTAEDYFGNHVRSRVWNTRRDNTRAGLPVDRMEWHMSPQTVNAYYNRGANEIVFPAGILQPPFFSGSNPEYLNFGGIGAVAGHELTHGFDNNGRLYDANGAYANWWTAETMEKFEQRAQCFVKQYANFTVPNLDGGVEHVNGELTLPENLADNGGLKKAYEAWQRRWANSASSQQGADPNQLLAGLEAYTREQLFFISFGRLWCSKALPQFELKKVRTDPHSPNRWRVVGVVQNSRMFAEAFHCTEGTPMNPKDKCEIW